MAVEIHRTLLNIQDTFIEGGKHRRKKAETKYTPLREVLQGKRVILVEDSIVRSTTMRVLLDRIREYGGAKGDMVRTYEIYELCVISSNI